MFAHIWAYAIRPYIYRQFTGNMLVLLDEDSSKQAVFCRKTVGAYRIRPHMSKHEITMANKYHHIQLNMVNGGGIFHPQTVSTGETID